MAMRSSAFSSRLARLSKRALQHAPLAAAAMLAACGPLDNDDPTFHVRGMNLITDSPTVKFYLGDTSVASATYPGGSSWHAGEAGSFNLNLKVIHPVNLNDDEDDDAEETAVGTPMTQAFEENKDYTVFAYGTLADPKLFVIDSTGQRDAPDDNLVVYQVANVAPNVQGVDVYVTAPMAGIDSAQLVATLTPGQISNPQTLTVEADPDAIDEDETRSVELTFELRVAGTNQTIYTSNTLTAVEQSRVVLVVADNIDAGPSPAKLMLLGSDGSTSTFVDEDDQARLRFVNVSKDSPALDVVVGSFQNPIAQAVGFRGQSPYSLTNTGEIGLIASATGNSESFAFIEEFTASPDQSYTAYAIGAGTDIDAFVLAEDPRSIPTQARFRFLAASPALEDELLDIYVLAPGKTIQFPDDNSSTTDTAPAFSDVAYRTNTNYLTLEGTSYDVYFAIADTENIVSGPVRVDIPNGANQTLVLTDIESGALELIPVSDTSS
jgi:Domain of unknown function (DUF4397)